MGEVRPGLHIGCRLPLHATGCPDYRDDGKGWKETAAISRLRNPVEECALCGHAVDDHDFLAAVPFPVTAVPCAHCPENVCDIENVRCPQCSSYVTRLADRGQHKMDCTEWRNGERARLELP